MAFIAVVTSVAGGVADIAPSISGTRNQPVAETSAGYLRPPVLLSTVPSVLARHQAEVAATQTPSQTAAAEAATEAPAVVSAAPQPAPAYFTYTIQPGDSLSSIAAQFGLGEDYLLWNNPNVSSDPDLLLVGATLLIPGTNGIVYNVAVGDNLNEIASYYQIDVGSIIGYTPNGISSPDMVTEGMVLVLPGAVPPAPAAPAVVAAVEPEPAPAFAPEPAAAEPAPAPEPEPAPIPQPSSGYIWPVYGPISTYFSWGHPGIDIDGFGNYGAPIAAAASGTVVLVAWDSWGYGYHVIIDHGDGSRTLYAHLSDIWVANGQYVSQGEAVGALGSTGYSTGAHLMFNLYIGGVAVDPLNYLP